jgi:hypothetical protein
MEELIIQATHQTPCIDFNGKTGRMEIKGRSIPDDPDFFWLPILNWFESYLLYPQHQTQVVIDLDYFNISSSKRLLFLLYKLNELVEKGHAVSVEWWYREADEEMYEVGKDYAYMVRVPFFFKEYSDNDVLGAPYKTSET